MTMSDSYCMCGEINSSFCHIHTEPHPRDRYTIEQENDKDET